MSEWICVRHLRDGQVYDEPGLLPEVGEWVVVACDDEQLYEACRHREKYSEHWNLRNPCCQEDKGATPPVTHWVRVPELKRD